MHYGTMHAFWLWVKQCEVHQGKAGDNEIVTKSYKCNCVYKRDIISCTYDYVILVPEGLVAWLSLDNARKIKADDKTDWTSSGQSRHLK